MKNEPTNPMAWDLNLATRMFQTGMNYQQISRVFGLCADTIHCRIDPEYRRKRQDQKNALRQYESPVSAFRRYGERSTTEEVAARLAEIPNDTRDFTARTFGDPVYVRSAAAQKPKTVQRHDITLPFVSILAQRAGEQR